MPHSFDNLGLIPELLQAVTDMGYEAPTPIQIEAIPHLLDGRDVMGQAQTGTGKTAAFGLPLLQHLSGDTLQALILTPTRELAMQTSDALYRYGRPLGTRVLPVYGGQPYDRQIRRLKNGVHVVVGTPGRTLDLIKRRALRLDQLQTIVLDEADEMLKMGFIEDIEAILGATDKFTRQTVLFSATFPDSIQRLASGYMNDPLLVTVDAEEVTVENISQRYYVVRESDKIVALSRLLEVEDMENTLIFARTRVGAAELAEHLFERGYPAEVIHGDLAQPARERILRRFRSGQVRILVGTDVVARGVDIPEVSHVINYNIPKLPIEYVHRIGRTGRAGRSGAAISLVTPGERHHLRRIEEYTHKALTPAEIPSQEAVLQRRDAHFIDQLAEQASESPEQGDTALLGEMMAQGYSPQQVALAAIAMLRVGERERPLEDIRPVDMRSERRSASPQNRQRRDKKREPGMVRLRMNLGRSTGLRPGDIVFGIASQANIPGRSIGAIDIRKNETFLDVKEADVDSVLRSMAHGRIRGRVTQVVRA